MAKRKPGTEKHGSLKKGTRKTTDKRPLPRGYKAVFTDLQRLIAESRKRALSTVNRELVLLYWQIG